MRPKGMGHVRTMQGVVNSGKPATRAQVVSRMNNLEHERERMARERDVWADKLRQTEEQIGQIDAQLAQLRALMASMLTEPEKPKRPKNMRSVSLEY